MPDFSRNSFSQNANRSAYSSRSSRSDFAKNVRNGGVKRQTKLAAAEIKSALFDKSGALKLSRKHRPDYAILILILILSITGLIILFSIAPALNGGNDAQTVEFMFKQSAFLILGIGSFFIASLIPLDFWRKYAGPIFIATLLLSIAVTIPNFPFTLNANGAQRWFIIGSFGTMQPAEFLKFGTMLFVAGFISVRASQNKLSTWRDLAPLLIVVIIALFTVIVLQKDLGTGVTLFSLIIAQLIVAGLSGRKIAAILTASLIAGLASIVLFSHRMDRIATYLGNGDESQNYQLNQSLIALGSGGFKGKGLGKSVQAFGWLPEQGTDAIFAIVGETLGWVGTVGIIVTFGFLLRRIIMKVDYTENLYLRLILAGVFGWLSAHVILNIGAMTSVVPLTGVTLPLVSFGGTSMICVTGALGIVFAISRYTTHRKISTDEIFSGAKPNGNSRNSSRLNRGRV